MRLHIGIAHAKQFSGAIDCGLLDHINKLTASVETITRITLKGLVGHVVSQRIEYGSADDVFRGNQFYV